MAKAKVQESMTAEENKQMDEMRKTDVQEQTESQEKVIEKPEDKIEGDESVDNKKNTMVPHGALEEERQRRKAAEKQAEDQRVLNARLEERQNLINEALTKKPEAKKEIPDPNKDALGALNMTMEEVKLLREAKENNDRENLQRQQFSSHVSMLQSHFAPIENEYIAKNPDYAQASEYLKNSRRQELGMLGFNQQQIESQIALETVNIADIAYRSGKSAPEMVHTMAKARGFVHKAAESDAEKLKKIEEGQKQNQSLSTLQGGAPNNKKIDGKTLATMSDAEFAKLHKALSGDQAAMEEIYGN